MQNSWPIALRLFLASLLIFLPVTSPAGTVILKKAFVEQYKNRATIDIHFTIDHAHKQPNPIGNDGQDGDLHSSGRSPNEVSLPMVTEVVNAASQKPAVDFIHQKEGTNQPVAFSGAWRLWFEHPAATQQIQGQPVPVPANTNPDHVFELHPVTQVQTNSVLSSFVPIPAFQAYDAQTAFGSYEKLKVTLQASQSAVQMNAAKAGYNYAEFVIELQGPPQQAQDGLFALATVLDTGGHTVVSQLRRMVFVKGTGPAARVQGLKKGDRLHVLGIPRVNLERISFLVASNGQTQVTTSLPYEMIIVGVFPK